MKSKILTILIILMMSFGIIPMTLDNVKAEGSTTFYSDADMDGTIHSFHLNYGTALSGGGTIQAHNTLTVIDIGQESPILNHLIYRGYLSFNTSGIPANERIVTATLYVRNYDKYTTGLGDFDLQVWNVSYNTLDIGDWGVTGNLEGILYNTSAITNGEWASLDVSTSAINRSGGHTQYKLNSSWEGTPEPPPPSALKRDTTAIYIGGSAYPPYLTVTTVTETEVIITYNFTNTGAIPTDAMVEYYDDHILTRLSTGFEDGTFVATNWTTFGSPVVTSSFAPYEGLFHAGASFGLSGAGNHTFEAPINATGHYNMTMSYYRKLQDVGGGSATFTFDWYNGTAWNILETFSTSSLYERSTWELNDTADNNPDLIFRFNVTVTAGAVNNGAWVDNAEIFDTAGVHQHSNSTIYPSEVIYWNASMEQIRYDVFVAEIHPTLESWIHLHVNDSYIYQSTHPNTVNVTDEGGGQLNITEVQHQEIFHHFWFLKPVNPSQNTNFSINIYPVEIIDWDTQNLYRYEFWNKNQSYIWLDMPNASFNYKSISPNANVTQLNSTSYNITETHLNEGLYWIWFTLNKTPVCPTFVSMYREVTGEGILWQTWAVYINEGSWTDPTNMTRLFDQKIDLDLGTTYCFSVYDYFPTPNIITNYSVIATCGQNATLFVDIPVPYSPLNFKSFRDDLSVFRIWYQAGGTPFTDHIPAYEWYQMDIRGGQYMIAIDYIDTTVNGTITILNTFYLNITADSNFAYTINIGTSQLTAIQTDVNGLELDIYTVTVAVLGDYVLNRSVMPITITDPTRSIASFNADLPILIHPYSVVDAEVYSNYTGVTSATFFDPTPDEPGTITIIKDEISVFSPFGTQIYINRSDSSNLINVTSPGIFDLTQYTNSTNVTFWSNGTSSLRRVTRFQHSSVFNWEYTSSIGQFVTALSLNNTSPFDWRNVHWWVGIPEGILMDTITKGRLPSIYDLNDREYWILGLDYKIDSSGGYYIDFAFFNSSTIRDLSFKFFEANATFYPGTATLEINEYWRQKFNVDDYWYGTGTWMNLEVATYKEDLFIVMENMDGRIDESSYFVLDGTENRLYNVFLQSSTETSATIRVTYIDLGDIPPGESFTVQVYFNYESFAVDGFPWVYFLLIALIILSVIAALIIVAKRKDKPILIIGSIIVASLLIIVAMIGFTLT